MNEMDPQRLEAIRQAAREVAAARRRRYLTIAYSLAGAAVAAALLSLVLRVPQLLAVAVGGIAVSVVVASYVVLDRMVRVFGWVVGVVGVLAAVRMWVVLSPLM